MTIQVYNHKREDFEQDREQDRLKNCLKNDKKVS